MIIPSAKMASLKTLLHCLLILLSMYMTIYHSEADGKFVVTGKKNNEFVVTGKKNKKWQVPSSSDEFNKWAEKKRFQIGNSIVFMYDSKKDSVLEVTEENYESCSKSNPIKSFKDGNTKIALDRSGPFFFISGAKGHCEKGQKLEIIVMSANHKNLQPVAPAPSPVVIDYHAPAPATSTAGSGPKTWWLMSCAVVVGILSSI